MKLLLIIPVMALFLSNIPFITEMPAAAAEEKELCCKKPLQEKMQCHPPKKENREKSGCCQGKESACSYTCCFNVVAPQQAITKFRFGLPFIKKMYAVYSEPNRITPFIEGLLQPPDNIG